jgi:hypothetical protein
MKRRCDRCRQLVYGKPPKDRPEYCGTCFLVIYQCDRSDDRKKDNLRKVGIL